MKNKSRKSFAFRNKYLAAFLALTLTFTTSFAQSNLFVEVTEVINGVPQKPRFIPYIAGVTNISGITQAQLDAAVSSRALQSFVVTQLNNKANTAHRHNASDIDNLPTTSTGSFQPVLNLPAMTFVQEHKPVNFGVTYSDGTQQQSWVNNGYSKFEGVNYLSNRPDVVYLWHGYNVNAANSRVSTLDAAYDYSIENHYDVPGWGSSFEFHMPRMKDKSNREHRLLSGYFEKTDGRGFWDMQANIFKIRSIINGTSKDLFSVTDGLINLHSTQNALGINFYHPVVTNYINFTGGVTQIKLNRSFFNSNAEAKAGGFKVGEEYSTRINGIKVIAIVE